MAITTIYDVKVNYLLTDKATKGLRGIGTAAAKSSRSTGLLSSSLGRITTLAGGFFGLRAAKSAFIDFNSTVEQSKLQIAGILALNMGGTVSKQLTVANQLFDRFQKIAAKSVGTTQDFVSFASQIVGPVTQAGLGMEELEKITARSVIAARAFGIAGEVAALDIQQALAGTLSARDRFARQLGLVPAEFNKLGSVERAQALLKALSAPALGELAAKQEKSFAGVVSTFQDKLQIALGKIGLPLFKALTKEIERWSVVIDKNQKGIEQFGRDFGKALVTGFKIIKDVAGFIIKHKDLLLTLAKSFLVFKAVKFGAGLLAGPIGAIQGLAAPANNAATGLSSFAGKLGGAATAIAAFAAAAVLVRDQILDRQEEEQKNLQDTATLRQKASETLGDLRSVQELLISQGKTTFQAERDAAALALLKDARERKLIEGTELQTNALAAQFKLTPAQLKFGRAQVGAGVTGALGAFAGIKQVADPEAVGRAIKMEVALRRALELEIEINTAIAARAKTASDLDQAAVSGLDALVNAGKQFGFIGKDIQLASQLLRDESLKFFAEAGRGMAKLVTDPLLSIAKAFGLAPEEEGKVAKKPQVNVTIQRIEVASDDPDRFVFDMVSAFQDAAKNPSSALGTFREG